MADPATSLASNAALGPCFPLRAARLFAQILSLNFFSKRQRAPPGLLLTFTLIKVIFTRFSLTEDVLVTLPAPCLHPASCEHRVTVWFLYINSADVQPVLQYPNTAVNVAGGIYWRFEVAFFACVIFSNGEKAVGEITAVVCV